MLSKFWRAIQAPFANEPRLRYFAFGLAAFIVVTLGVSWVAKGLHDPRGDNFAAFWLGLTGALWEDLIFFLLLGGVAVIISLNRPGDAALENRVGYFFNGRRVTAGAKTHIGKEITRLGIFSPLYVVKLYFTEIDTTLDAIRVVIQADRSVVNMFKDEVFEDVLQAYNLATDEVGPAGALQGELVDAYVEQDGERTHVILGPEPIRGALLKKSAKFSLGRDGESAFGYRAWLWHRCGSAYTVSPTRYTERLVVCVFNHTGRSLRLHCADARGERVLTDQGAHTYIFPQVPAGEIRVPYTLIGVQP